MKLLFAALLLFALLYPVYVVHKQTLGSHEKIEKSPAEWGAEYEDIEFKTEDGLMLKGWWVPNGSAKAVLLLHGNGGSRNGFTSGVFELGKWYHDQGYNVMMADLRAHGESEGERITFGVKESKDMLGWIEKLDAKKSYLWTIHGFSMGAVTALMMKEKEPARFEKVVADAPWIDFEILAKQELWRRANLPPLLYGYVGFVAKNFFGLDFKEADNKERCKKLCKERVLYIFESEDRLVTKTQQKVLKESCPKAQTLLFEGVGHVDAFKQMPHEYTGRLKIFLETE